MTPGARVQAAIEILDQIADGMAAEQALTRWARNSRFAGSKDRAAVRDHVFDVLRRWQSCARLGGSETGRGRMIGLCRDQGLDLANLFSGQGHAPEALSPAELADAAPLQEAAQRDLPDWLWPLLCEGREQDAAHDQAMALRQRAPVDLRVNLLRGSVAEAQASLEADGIETDLVPLCDTALRVTHGARQVGRSRAYETGLVELQDVASQAVIAALDLQPGQRVLDFCAGGGGKALAMAAVVDGPVDAHDVAPERMKDLPQRAKRAGAVVPITHAPEGPYDVVLCDAPCSGSGAWRRAPLGKWRLTPADLERCQATQAAILDEVLAMVAPGGLLAYATCSLLACENTAQVSAFLARNKAFRLEKQRQFELADGGDGFFIASFRRVSAG